MMGPNDTNTEPNNTGTNQGHVYTLVLNALVDLVTDERTTVTDDESREIVQERYRTATTQDQRDAFQAAVAHTVPATDDSPIDSEVGQTLEVVADTVASAFADRSVEVTLDHEARLSLARRDASLYTFGCTMDPAVIEQLSLPSSIRRPVRIGVEHVENREFDQAAECFERAVDERGGHNGAVTARVLAAWACHWNGDDGQALDLVEEALHLDTRTWSAKVVGLAASHRYPDKFRQEKLGVRAFLRSIIEIPTGSSVMTSLETVEDARPQRTELTGPLECMPIDRLGSEVWIRLRLQGVLPSFPTMQGYYVGLGIVDLEVNEVRSVERVLLSGPEAAETHETLRFRN